MLNDVAVNDNKDDTIPNDRLYDNNNYLMA
jgi:hypothetical protein